MNLQHLQSRHKELSEKIVDAYQHYLSDNVITKLKKERLRIKSLIFNELKNTWQKIKYLKKPAKAGFFIPKRFMMECNSFIIGFMNDIIRKHLEEHQSVLATLESLAPQIETVAKHMIKALQNGKTIFWCGNGGSASDAQHLAAELVGRFVGDRKALKSISLNADSAVMTCIVNDYGYEHIFSRQVEGLGINGDVLVGITTSGNSENVLNAITVANQKQMTTISLLGKGGGKALSLVSEAIVIDSNTTARIQEMHIIIGHILCDLIEEGLNLKAWASSSPERPDLSALILF